MIFVLTFLSFSVVAVLMEMRFAFLKLEGTQPKQIQKSSLDQALKTGQKKA